MAAFEDFCLHDYNLRKQLALDTPQLVYFQVAVITLRNLPNIYCVVLSFQNGFKVFRSSVGSGNRRPFGKSSGFTRGASFR